MIWRFIPIPILVVTFSMFVVVISNTYTLLHYFGSHSDYSKYGQK